MKMDWHNYINKTLYITMHENFGLAFDPKADAPIFEIVFKSGKLIEVYDDALLLEATRENQIVKIFIPFASIKCVEIFNI